MEIDWCHIAATTTWKELCQDKCFVEIYSMYLEEYPNGGVLHIVIIDGNNDDDDILWCYNTAKENGDVAAMWLATKLITIVDEDREEYNWELI